MGAPSECSGGRQGRDQTRLLELRPSLPRWGFVILFTSPPAHHLDSPGRQEGVTSLSLSERVGGTGSCGEDVSPVLGTSVRIQEDASHCPQGTDSVISKRGQSYPAGGQMNLSHRRHQTLEKKRG